MLKRIYLLFTFLLVGLLVKAQDFEIVSVEHLPNDFSAREEMKTDHSDRQCALLRIATQKITPEQREGFTFKPDLGSEQVERATRNGEIWLWVSPGLKYLRVMHRDWGQYELKLLDYVSRVESLHTYKIVVKGPEFGSGPKDNTPRQQYLAFQITPPNAFLEVDGKPVKVNSDGSASKYVDFGVHTYSVRATDYFPKEGNVIVDDPDNTVVVKLALDPDFAEVTLRVDADAEIWVNNERKGVRTWTGVLGSDLYKIECKQANHETSEMSLKISADMAGRTFTLPVPKPIYGSLNVESMPDFATIYIDGEEVGKTPKSVREILIGQHEIRLAKEGYADYTETINITKGERKQVIATLSNGKQVQFTCNVPDAQLEIDGQRVGSANGTYMLTYGSHSLRATATDYREYTANLSVSQSGSGSYSIQMQSITKDEETFTVNGVSFTMKLVEGGTFRMGATSEQVDAADDSEKPVHSVTLSNYYMGETEVTQSLWRAVMGEEPTYSGGWEPEYGRGNDYPAYRVNWNDCQEFICKLNQKTGRNFRLPTEAEWEYAARGGKKSKGYMYSGNNNIDGVAWHIGNSSGKTHAVKTKYANELGLFDMSGNVWEWCGDMYDDYMSGSQVNPNPQRTRKSYSQRVLRGGSWDDRKWDCRVSLRGLSDPIDKDAGTGFRLCLPR